jgi:hypothetical protein
MKICFKCNVEKSLVEFSKNKATQDGLCINCKSCQKEYGKHYRENNREKLRILDKKYKENNKEKIREKEKLYRENNPEKFKEKHKKYYQANKEKISEKTRTWYAANTERMAEYRRKINEAKGILPREVKGRDPEKVRLKAIRKRKSRMGRDPLFRTRAYIRTSIWNSLSNSGYGKNSKTSDILGCTFEEFYAHIESQFLEGMNWGNRAEWHIDHIVPISFACTEEEVILLNHYSNLRPLWSLDNLRKSDVLTEDSISHPLYLKIVSERYTP